MAATEGELVREVWEGCPHDWLASGFTYDRGGHKVSYRSCRLCGHEQRRVATRWAGGWTDLVGWVDT